MTTIDQELVSRSLACRSQMLRVFHEAAEADLAVSPLVIIADEPGCGVTTFVRSIAQSGEAKPTGFIRIDCTQVCDAELKPMTVPVEGGLDTRAPAFVSMADTAGIETGSIILLTQAASAPRSTVLAALETIASAAAGPVIVVLTDVGGRDEEDRMLALVSEGLGLHKAHVPTARLSMDTSRPMPAQPVLLHGIMSETGCKRGERYMEIEVAEPYFRTVRFVVNALDGQDDDTLVEALEPHLDSRGGCSVRLEIENGDLSCGSDDITGI